MSTPAQPTPGDNYASPSHDFTNHGHGEFDLDQAAMLQDMARSSTAGEGDVHNMYAYDHDEGMRGFDGSEKEQEGVNSAATAFPDPAQLLDGYNKEHTRDRRSNGGLIVNESGREVTEYTDYTQPSAPLHEHDDVDPVTLLEALANFDTTPMNTRANARTGSQDGQRHDPQSHQFSNDHFASLLQAAETAGQSQDNDNIRMDSRKRNTKAQIASRWGGPPGSATHFRPPVPRTLGEKRKQSPNAVQLPEPAPASGFIKPGTRRKKTKEIDPDQLAREHAIWGSASESENDADDGRESHRSGPQVSTSDARAAGVHSAAALFRRPTPASKKYTRPPMSKLFTSLELTPEQFLYLQAAAKTYMLDPAHGERAGCVGNKARADTDLVKLKLFGCVEAFLEDEGWGERCWGPDAGRGAHESRRLRWPEGKHKIITLVTPLMRRMVTNERQRLYANETRKATGGKKVRETGEGVDEQRGKELVDIDPKLGDYHYTLDPTLRSPAAAAAASTTPPAAGPEKADMVYRVVVVERGVPGRVLHSTTLTQEKCPVFSSLMQHVRSVLAKPLNGGGEGEKGAMYILPTVKALLPTGLVEVGTVDEWEEACRTVEGEAWMEGIVRVVAEVEKASE
ncbi:hypothetical protein VE01_02110 [Pseudogymnoascus verrucosus]|uniref:Uncharacterized protein n=1 Tax=Pseudogymnoascus verrucosus TaxID=342668 RepID=A0A1B8GVH5_9PEZI|nr:uncharacterized protein VE01_02110 [Pseudogymnoascus verrucosus]OBT99829.1 hypothetical protein VE01_02110 [Pseudogymnoascus verrucosus]